MGLARPLRGTRRTERAGARRGRPAGRGGGSPAAPGPLSRPLRASHFTPRRPRPRLCGAGNTPCRPDRTCSFPATPSLPRGRRPPGAGKNLCGARAHLRPGCAQLAVAGGGAPSRGAQREGPGACSVGSEDWAASCSHRQGTGAMQTSGHLAWTPARRRGSCSRGSRKRRGRQRGPEAWGTGRGAVLRDREKERGREEVERTAGRVGGFWRCGRRRQSRAPRSRGTCGALRRPAGATPRETTKWTDGMRVAPPG